MILCFYQQQNVLILLVSHMNIKIFLLKFYSFFNFFIQTNLKIRKNNEALRYLEIKVTLIIKEVFNYQYPGIQIKS